MADITRTAEATWTGGLKGGSGRMNAGSGLFKETPYSFATRFESAPGTNPEELLAAAHAACFSMAFSATLEREGFPAQEVHTRATCHLSPKPEGGFRISKMRLETRGKVAGLDGAKFQEIAKKAEQGCPVSNALRGGIEIELAASLM
jgi:osmotically inducible protein OsmC